MTKPLIITAEEIRICAQELQDEARDIDPFNFISMETLIKTLGKLDLNKVSDLEYEASTAVVNCGLYKIYANNSMDEKDINYHLACLLGYSRIVSKRYNAKVIKVPTSEVENNLTRMFAEYLLIDDDAYNFYKSREQSVEVMSDKFGIPLDYMIKIDERRRKGITNEDLAFWREDGDESPFDLLDDLSDGMNFLEEMLDIISKNKPAEKKALVETSALLSDEDRVFCHQTCPHLRDLYPSTPRGKCSLYDSELHAKDPLKADPNVSMKNSFIISFYRCAKCLRDFS